MISHFQWKPLYESLPGWSFSFFYKGSYYNGIYNQDGSIEWKDQVPPDEEKINAQIHELMLFHVYES